MAAQKLRLVTVSPCEHGRPLRSVRALLPGAHFSDPACTDSRGRQRRHVVKEPKA